jgi:hypothetical protein
VTLAVALRLRADVDQQRATVQGGRYLAGVKSV